MPQWSDKVIEPMSEDKKRMAMEDELFTEIDRRMTKALSWVARMIGNKSVGPDTRTLLAFRIYDELKVLDEKLENEQRQRIPVDKEGEGTQTSDAEKLNPGTPPSCTGCCR